MIRLLCLCVFLSGSFSSVFAAASAEDHSPQELTRKYLKVLGYTEGLPEIKTHKEGFECMLGLAGHLSGRPHKHVSSGPQYGFSFIHKNIPPVDFMRDLLTGKKNWQKEKILTKALSIADIGCGLGFSATYFISEVAKVYESEPGWDFASPIRIDLYDISPEHQSALQPLAALVNAVYPKYFHVEAFVQDAANAFPEKKYKAVFALNLMHYVPEAKWPNVTQNLEEILQDKGVLFITTDHYQVGTCNDGQFQSLEAAAKKPEKSPFSCAFVPLVNPDFGEHFQTKPLNTAFDSFLKNPKEYVPGVPRKIEDIDISVVESVLRRNAREHGKWIATVGLYDGQKLAETSVEEVIARLKDGRLFIQLGNYGFDETLLEKAILGSSKGTLAPLKTLWSKGLLPNCDGYPSSVGLTFTKK